MSESVTKRAKFLTMSFGILAFALAPVYAAAASTHASRWTWRVVAPQRPQPLFHLSSGVAVDPAGNVYVADSTESRLKKISPRGKLLASWGSDRPGPRHWTPRAVSAPGDVYLLASDLVRLSPAGKILARWDPGPAEVMQADRNGDVFVAVGVVSYATLSGHVHVTEFTSNGDILYSWDTPTLTSTDVVQANGLALDHQGNVYVSVANANNTERPGPSLTSDVYRYSPDGALLGHLHAGRVTLGAVQGVDSRGNLYLSLDTYYLPNGAGYEKLSPVGKLLGRWTSAGGKPFGDHVDLAVDSHDNVVVADSHGRYSGVVRVLTGSGKQLHRWGSIYPFLGLPLSLGVAVGVHGSVYATTNDQHIFLRVDPGKADVHLFGQSSTHPPILYAPQAIAVDRRANVYVTDETSGTINKLSSSGRRLARWALVKPGSGPVVGLALDRHGNSYVLAVNHIVKLSPSGHILARYARTGSAPGLLSGPENLAVDAHDNIYVADTHNNRVQKFSPSGRLLQVFSAPGQLENPLGVAVNPAGDLYVLDPSHSDIMVFSSTGRVLNTLGAPGVLTGQLSSPTSLAIDTHGNLFVLDYGNNRIQEAVRH